MDINNNTEEYRLPLLPLRNAVSFPGVQLNIEVERSISLAAFTAAATMHDMKILLVTQRDLSVQDPTADDLYSVGVLAMIKHVVKTPQNTLSVLFEGICRCSVYDVISTGNFLEATATPLDEIPPRSQPALRPLIDEIKKALSGLSEIHPSYTDDITNTALAISDPLYFSDFIASSALIDYSNKQTILESLHAKERMERLLVCLAEERMLLECEKDIQKQVKEKIDHSHKEYFLREQLRAIQAELGEDEDEDILEYERAINGKDMPEDIRQKLMKELIKLSKTPFGAAESTVIRSYLDTCLEYPFGIKSEENTDMSEVKEILDRDHDGLDKIKRRILEYVAVKSFSGDIKHQIICLVGPPGVGKTSVAESIARALGRKYARVSLGGMHDEAEIRGHRKTYVGAMPGRIVKAICSSGSENPLIVLDEIDKLANDSRSDPTSAMLEVLDPEQNARFRDNFLEFPIDLSSCMFIATANGYDRIPAPLLDRMEIIELSSYTDTEKLAIAKNHLIPKQLKKHGMLKKHFKITDSAVLLLIKSYTREAGVRNLEREIASLIRKAATRIASGESKSVSISEKNLKAILGKEKVIPEELEGDDLVGVVNGLAYTDGGGALLKVEVAVMDGTGKIELTGSLGEVMKESAKISLSYVRTIAKRYNIDPDFYKNRDIHIHFPEGAVPKDGPSAGVTMVTAIVSALSGIPTKKTIAMTGEISLRGRVLPIGGLKEKTLAAYRAGVSTVLIPQGNVKDLDEVDKEARENLCFIPCEWGEDVLKNALKI